MLLTTLALVKCKVGKLPNRHNKLYAEAVAVLLNWNLRHYRRPTSRKPSHSWPTWPTRCTAVAYSN
jgi:hypothetical protein